jgi:hypothetical protein
MGIFSHKAADWSLRSCGFCHELRHVDQVVGGKAMVHAMRTRSSPRNLVCRKPPMVFSQPKISSIRLRFLWLSA